MAETALRHRLHESVADHRHRIATMWADASAIATANPQAWIRHPHDADRIAEEGPRNRAIASPYPKLMTANLDVDQGGAIVICSAAAAEAAGVARDRWVFPWSGVAAADHWFPTNRWAFDESPAMRFAGRRALELVGLGVDDCGLLDLYSCFPVAVQVAQRELGIDSTRPFTITGGLTFAAGPLNSYCMLALTRAVTLLREAPDTRALLTGNGGYFTKHAMLVLSGTPAGGFVTDNVQCEVDALPSRPTPDASSAPGPATLETYTVLHDRDGNPTRAILASLDAGGRRHFQVTDEIDVLHALLANDCCNLPLTHFAPGHTLHPTPPPVE
jgi:acetyl-CoA C-acetyltransferase